MKSKDNDQNLDAIDLLLKAYLLSRDPKGPDGESLMASVMAGSEGVSPSESPSPEREAELLSALQKQFAKEEEPEIAPKTTEIPFSGAGENPMDTELKSYLIAEDPKGNDGVSLMQYAFESSSVETPEDVPSPEQEARMIAALKAEFVPKEDEDDKPVVPFWTLRNRIIAISLAAAAAIALLFIFNPFSGNEEGISGEVPGEIAEDKTPSEGGFVPDEGTVAPNLEAPEDEFIAEEHAAPGPDEPVFQPEPWEEERPRVAVTPKVKKDRPELPVVENVGPYSTEGLFAQTASESQWFDLEAGQGKVIKGAKGTRVHIPAHCFVDGQGNPVEGPIALEVKELYSGKDFLLSNMPTGNDDQPRVSGGSLFLEARKGAEVLSVAANKSIRVEFDTPEAVETAGMQVYAGAMNPYGEISWTPAVASEERLIPLTIEDLQFEELYLAPEEIERMVESEEADRKTLNAWNRIVQDATSAAYSDSWIRTREFLARMIIAHDFGLDAEIVERYTEESDSGLARADRMVAQMLRERNTPEDLRLARVFDDLAAQNLGYAEPFRNYGINFESPDARERLARRKVSEAEIDRLMEVHELQKEYKYEVAMVVTRWKKRDQGLREMIAQGNKSWKSIIPNRGYGLQQTGWANLNKPLRSQQKVEMAVSHSGDVPQAEMNTYMVLDGVPALLKARNKGADGATFQQVPNDRNGWIVSLGFQNSQPYFGYKKVRAGSETAHELTIRKTNIKTLKKKLEIIN